MAEEHRWARHANIPAEGPIIVIACGGNMASPALMHSFASRVPGGLEAAERCDVVPLVQKTTGWSRLGDYLFERKNWMTATLAGLAVVGSFLAGRFWHRESLSIYK